MRTSNSLRLSAKQFAQAFTPQLRLPFAISAYLQHLTLLEIPDSLNTQPGRSWQLTAAARLAVMASHVLSQVLGDCLATKQHAVSRRQVRLSKCIVYFSSATTIATRAVSRLPIYSASPALSSVVTR